MNSNKKTRDDLQKELASLSRKLKKAETELEALSEKNNRLRKSSSILKADKDFFKIIYEDAPIGIVLVDTDTNILRANKYFVNLLGYTEPELLKMNVNDITHPEDYLKEVGEVKNLIEQSIDSLSIRKRYIKKNGDYVWVNLTTNIIRSSGGKYIWGLGMVEDISAQKLTEEKLIESETRLKLLANNMIDCVSLLDSKGKIIYATPSHLQITGFDPQEMIGKSIFEYVHPDDSKIAFAEFRKRIKERIGGTFELRLKHKYLGYVWMSISGNFIRDEEGKLDKMIFSGKDISERKSFEEQLIQSERKYRELLEQSIQGVLVVQDTGIAFVNQAFCDISMYSFDELLSFDMNSAASIVHPEDRSTVVNRIQNRLSGKYVDPHYRFRLIRKDGETRWLEIYSRTIDFNGKLSLQAVLMDITDNIIAEEALKQSEERQRIILESSEDIIALMDRDFKYLYYNGSPRFGFKQEDLVGKSPYEFFPKEAADEIYSSTMQVFETRLPNRKIEKVNLDNEEIWFDVVRYPVFDRNKKVTAVTTFSRNITDRVLANIELERSLKEKEVLLKEIHHRVKNNLNIIIGLLELQSDTISDDSIKSLFTDSTNRIRSMALIHERLYQAENLSGIELGSYLQSLAEHVLSAYRKTSAEINLETKLDKITISIDQAIPCGLIVNEVVTNSMKYAFVNKEKGNIGIILSIDSDRNVILKIKDDGIGLPESFSAEQSTTLGLQLIELLVKQLRGEYRILKETGTTFHIQFPSY